MHWHSLLRSCSRRSAELPTLPAQGLMHVEEKREIDLAVATILLIVRF